MITTHNDSAGEIPDDFNVGDALWTKAVAQDKVTVRKRWMAAAEKMVGSYTVRYVQGGVEMRRVA